MNGEPTESTFMHTSSIPEVQRRAIAGAADIRRRSQILGMNLTELSKSPFLQEADITLKTSYEEQSREVSGVMSGALVPEPAGDLAELSIEERVSSYVRRAKLLEEATPNLSALYFAKAAALQQADGLSYAETLDNAKENIEKAEKQGFPRTTPADFLPDAYVLGISKKATEDAELPSAEDVAHAIEHDKELLKDYALILPEDQRDAFLESVPEHIRKQVSLRLDQSVSGVLDGKLVVSEQDKAQRDAVIDRVRHAFQESIDALKRTDYLEKRDGTGRDLGSRWSSRQIAETISNLGEDDALQVLRDITQRSTRETKDLNKDLRKLPLTDRAKALHPSLSFTARVLDTLIEADIKRGGTLAMRYLEMSALPNPLFNFFAEKLASKEYFTHDLLPFIEDANVPVLKKLMARYGPQFNTIIDTLAQAKDYAFDHDLATRETELLEALSDLDTLTPRIFDRYRNLPQGQRKEFAEKIRDLKPKFFKNAPIGDILDRSDRDILTEMVYMTYKPMGMSFEQVGRLIRDVGDHTSDIASYTFPEDGYSITLETEGKHVVKERQKIDLDSLKRFRNLFLPVQIHTAEGEVQPFPVASAFRTLLKPEPATDLEQSNIGIQNADLNALLLPLQGQTRVQDFIKRYPTITGDNAYQAASEMAELSGVYFQDNYGSTLTEYLDSHPEELQQILSLLEDTQVRTAVTDRLRQFNQEVDWHELDRATEPEPGALRKMRRAFVRPPSVQPQDIASKILGQLVNFDQMELVRKHLESELSKFTVGTDTSAAYKGQLKAYMSKNVGSFFAKAAAGICTAQDIPLFERPDHFHINVVENDEDVRANIQAYIEKVNGKPSLILRGFNPTPDWVTKIDVGSFCDQITAIGKQFQAANGLGPTYITEQYGGWHALSNREQVAKYLDGKYISGKEATPFPLKVTNGTTIREIYQI